MRRIRLLRWGNPHPTRPRHDAGSALMVAIFVLAVLVALAAPLVLYFVHAHRRAIAAEERVRAALAAEGAIDHALAYAYLTAEGNERWDGNPEGYRTPDYDTWDEFKADFSFSLYPRLAQALFSGPAGLSFNEPDGLIWHAEIEDEQGKVNINSATPQLLGNLLGSATLARPLSRDDVVMYVDTTLFFDDDGDADTLDGRLRLDWEEIGYSHLSETTVEGLVRNENQVDETTHRRGALVYDARAYDIAYGVFKGNQYLPYISSLEAAYYVGYHHARRLEALTTVYSGLEGAAGWQRREQVEHRGLTADAKGLRVRDAAGLGNGAIIRLILNGQQIYLGRVAWTSKRGDRWSVWLDREIGVEVLETDELFIEARLPHPVNINTAGTRVLSALFKGVGLKGSSETVDSVEAQALAEQVCARYFRGPSDFEGFLDGMVEAGAISGDDKRALFLNATVPFSPDLRVVTAPFTYRSLGDVTLVGRVVSSDRLGRTAARLSIETVASLPAENSGEWGLSSQAEFEKERAASNSPGVVTWPQPVIAGRAPDGRGLDLKTGEDTYGDVRLLSLRDERPLERATVTEHFEKEGGWTLTPEGADLSNGGHLPYDASKCLVRAGNHWSPLYFSAWVKAKAWDARMRYLFSVGSSADTDRISYYYDGRTRELVVEVAGPDLEKGYSSFRLPFDPEADTWYHLACRVSGDRPADAHVYVDGMVGEPARLAYKPSARLEASIGEDDTSIPVSDAGSLPRDGGVVQIGQEIIEYRQLDGNTLMQAKRGARYSYKQTHLKDELVIPFGYSNRLARDFPRGGAVLVGDVAANPSCQLTAEVSATDTSLTVTSTAGFPPAGFLRISGRDKNGRNVSENVYYTNVTGTSFDGLARGELNTQERDFVAGGRVSSLSLQISGPFDYRSGEYVSLDGDGEAVEWMYAPSIVSRSNRTHIVHSVNAQGVPTGEWRGTHGTGAMAHRDGAKVLPVAWLRGPQCGDVDSPKREEITIIEGSNRESARIKRAFAAYWPNRDRFGNITGYSHLFLASLYDFTRRAYGGGDSRFLKAPSGEMPLAQAGTAYVAAERPSSSELLGCIDELRIGANLSPQAVLPPDKPVSSRDAKITVVEPYSGWSGSPPRPRPRASGLAIIGSECVYYRQMSSGSLTMRWGEENTYAQKRDSRSLLAFSLDNCIRGALDTTPQTHYPGEPVQFLDDYPVSLLVATVPLKGDSVALMDASQFPSEGYLLVYDGSREVLGWTGKSGNDLTGCQHIRGAFGTRAAQHTAGFLACLLPIRYHSRYEREYDGPDLVYFAAAKGVKEAVWTGMSYSAADADGSETASSGLRTRVLLRFSEDTGWDAKPAGGTNSLFEFTSDGMHALPRVRSNQVQLRVYYEYLPGAFNGNDWKRTLRLENIFLYYQTLPVIRRCDVTEK